jgi:hypothetical protein
VSLVLLISTPIVFTAAAETARPTLAQLVGPARLQPLTWYHRQGLESRNRVVSSEPETRSPSRPTVTPSRRTAGTAQRRRPGPVKTQ